MMGAPPPPPSRAPPRPPPSSPGCAWRTRRGISGAGTSPRLLRVQWLRLSPAVRGSRLPPCRSALEPRRRPRLQPTAEPRLALRAIRSEKRALAAGLCASAPCARPRQSECRHPFIFPFEKEGKAVAGSSHWESGGFSDRVRETLPGL